MGFFMPDPDPRLGYFGSADLSGLNNPELLGPMPFGIPLAAIRSAFGAPEEAPLRRDGDSYEIAGGPPCQGPSCQSGGNWGTSGMYTVTDKDLCVDCAVKKLGIGDLPADEKTEILSRYLKGGGGSDGSGSSAGGGSGGARGAGGFRGGGGGRGGGGFIGGGSNRMGNPKLPYRRSWPLLD